MTLAQPEEKKNLYQQPVFQFDQKKEVRKPEVKEEVKAQAEPTQQEIKAESTNESVVEKMQNSMSPTLSEQEIKEPILKQKVTATKINPAQPQIIHFELLSDEELDNFNAIPTPVTAELPKTESYQDHSINKKTVTAQNSGSYLTKPSNLYVDEQLQQNEIEKTIEEPTLPLIKSAPLDEPLFEMELVVKDSAEALTEEPCLQQGQQMMMPNEEQPQMLDEADGLKRKALERINKLRNLSFNINSADPNNEFEAVPAYLRRNMELHNSIADVESFYSNYTVKSDQNNQAVIGSINTFLDGKKPD
jgi:cell division protein FtsZ